MNVNIGYCMKPVSRIEVDFQFTDTPTHVVFGAWGDTGSSAVPQLRTAFWISDSTYRFILSDTKFDSRDTTVAIDTERHVAVIDVLNHKCRLQTVNGELEGKEIDFPACSKPSDWPVSLFGSSKNAAGDGNQHVQAKIYSVKVYENDVLVHDFVPCIKGRDAGFYDEKTGDFRYGTGQYELVCGGDGVKTIPDDGYLQSSGSQYFNTDYKMNPNSRIEVDFQYPNAATANFLFGTYGDDAGINAFMWNDGNPKQYKFHLKDGAYVGAANLNTGIQCGDTNRFTAVMDIAAHKCSMRRNGYERWTGKVDDTKYTLNNNGTWPLVLFGSAKNAAGDGKNGVSARIYSAKIYEKQQDGTYALVKEFVPYVKDGAAGFMEKVSGTFSEVKGVSAGGDIEHTKCSYIENDGTTSLNLGYLANMRSRIEVDYQSLDASAGKLIFGAWANDSSAGSLRYAFWSNSGNNNKIQYIFHGNSANNPQYVTSFVHNNDRHTAVVDMNNQMMYYITGGTTNYSQQATAGTFSSTDESAIPLAVWGYISGSAAAMQAKARIYSVRIYEDEAQIHEFLPYTDGTTTSLRDVITGHVATKVKSDMAEPTIQGIGVDGVERWFVTPQNATVSYSKSTTLKAVAAGAVKRYKWTKNGEAVEGGANGELTVAWHHGSAPDIYAVTAVYSLAGAEVDGEPKTVEVTNEPQGLMIIVR